jgi:protein ImuB
MLNAPRQAVAQAIGEHPQPCWILPSPLPLALNSKGPSGLAERPIYQGPLQLLAGPHRVEAGWWDDLTVARDYYVAHSEHAGLLWVFRERHAPDTRRSPWFLHGFFA